MTWGGWKIPTEIAIVLCILVAQIILPSAITDFFGSVVVALIGYYIGKQQRRST